MLCKFLSNKMAFTLTELTSQQTKSVPWAAPIYQTIAANTTLSHLNLNNNRLKITMMQALLQKP